MTKSERKQRARLVCATVWVGALLVAVGGSCACSSGSNGGGTHADGGITVHVDPNNGLVDIYGNPAEPRLYDFTDSSTGQLVTVFGQKDSNGFATGLTALLGQDPSKVGTGQGTWVYFDDEGHVSGVTAADGTALQLSWLSDTSVVISGVTADGVTQANTSVDLSAALTAAPAAPLATRAGAPHRAWVEDASPSVTPREEPLFTPVPPRPWVVQPTSVIIRATVKRCGAAVDSSEIQEVHMTANDTKNTTFPATLQSSGQYAVSIPIGSLTAPDDQTIAKICASLGRIALKSCKSSTYAQNVKTKLCGKLAAALDASGIAGQGMPISDACNKGFSDLLAHCNLFLQATGVAELLDSNNPNAAADAASTFICAMIKEKLDSALIPSGADLLVTATATLSSGGSKTSNAVDATAASAIGGTPPLVTIDFGTDAKLGALTLSPAAPPAGTSYTVSVTVSCGAGNTFTINVVGTDGYQQSDSYTPTGATQTLNDTVPGGAQGVSDTVIVVDSSGNVLRQAVLTFQ
jgi:hypothetical protein